jgi:hypothetical protein
MVDNNGRMMIAQGVTLHELTSVNNLCVKSIGNCGQLFHA